MLNLLISLLGFLFPNQNAATISSQDQNPMVVQTTSSDEGDTGGETGDNPPKK